jgi:phosphomevalonate kinase
LQVFFKFNFKLILRKAFNERKFQNNSKNSFLNFEEIILISDCRRPTDIQFFINNFKKSKIISIRINSKIEERQKRGFNFIEDIDNKESECSLDNFNNWDFYLNNNENINDDEKEDKIGLKNIINYLKLIIF